MEHILRRCTGISEQDSVSVEKLFSIGRLKTRQRFVSVLRANHVMTASSERNGGHRDVSIRPDFIEIFRPTYKLRFA